MRSGVSHLVYNVDAAHLGFYRDVFAQLGWSTIMDEQGMLGLGIDNGTSIWFGAYGKPVANDYDGPGLNHLALSAESINDVDAFTGFLGERGIEALFETPRHRPEFSAGEGQTYYQVMFQSPDNILFEFVYTGPYAAS